ncbi:hypothetical protein HUT16_16490 [Kitasatospora sp. NA04385]|uniref:hypothetical protein n=1 Tax=Kitasatospora sp. NA04385 TaxID=2742135 RepID=UPI001591B7FB|nr:hypothetical protein [Kitasatospora sp. NA04385]QKW20455.1 hypothetical protein HUT16_16490 [Kitasatospora sp. NA04385]
MGSARWRMLVWVGAGVSVAGLAVFLWAEGLDRANQWAGVLGLFVGVAGLVLTLAGGTGGRSGGQSADGAAAGGSVRLVRGVQGDVVIDAPSAPGPVPEAAPDPVPGAAPPAGGLSARNVRAGGDVELVDGVEGSVRFGGPRPTDGRPRP